MAQIEKLHCRGCGAVLPVKAKSGRIKCEYCGTVHLVDAQQKMVSGGLACPNCGFNNAPGSQYCGDCGEALFHTCPKCGTQNRIENIFCITCGADIEKTIREEGPHKNINVDDLYSDYLLESKKLFGEMNQSMMGPSLVSGLMISGALMIWLFNYLEVFNLGKIVPYAPALGIAGFVLMIILMILFSIKLKTRIARITKSKPGFDKFYKTIRAPGGVFNWPDALPDDTKRKEFLFLIGQK